MDYLVDSCVILDVLLTRKEFFDESAKIFRLAGSGKINAYITSNSVTDIFYACHKVSHDIKASKAAIKTLIEVFTVIDVNGTDCTKALESKMNDFEDALLVEAGIRNSMDFIITRNIKDFKESAIPAILPSQL